MNPKHVGEQVGFVLDAFRKGRWIFLLEDSAALSSQSRGTAVIVYAKRRIIGVPLRIYAEFSGDKRNSAANSKGAYLRITS